MSLVLLGGDIALLYAAAHLLFYLYSRPLAPGRSEASAYLLMMYLHDKCRSHVNVVY